MKRVHTASDRVTVSKPGYDAESPPAVDYKYLALDSRLNQGRPLEVGIFLGTAFGTGGKVYYSTTYPHPPAVDVVGFGPGPLGSWGYGRSMVTRDANSSIAYQRSSWATINYTDGFAIADDFQYRHAHIWGTTLNLYFIAWKVW